MLFPQHPTLNTFMLTKLGPGELAEFPIDFLAPEENKNHSSCFINHSGEPEQRLGGDYITIPMISVDAHNPDELEKYTKMLVEFAADIDEKKKLCKKIYKVGDIIFDAEGLNISYIVAINFFSDKAGFAILDTKLIRDKCQHIKWFIICLSNSS